MYADKETAGRPPAGRDPTAMPAVVGVRFRRAGKIHYYDPSGLQLDQGDHVVARTERGLEIGQVVFPARDVLKEQLTEDLQSVVRSASEEDRQRVVELRALAEDAFSRARTLARSYRLPAKIVKAEYPLDGDRLNVTYAAEGRVDLRDVARELGTALDVKVEFLQIGPREHAKLIGGYGHCGQELCCARWLTEFTPITIKMAKVQDLPLNPSKLAGVCGRLRCCLRYEVEDYMEMRKLMPRAKQRILTDAGPGTVRTVQFLKEQIVVQLDDGRMTEITLKQVVSLDGPPRAVEPQAAARR